MHHREAVVHRDLCLSSASIAGYCVCRKHVGRPGCAQWEVDNWAGVLDEGGCVSCSLPVLSANAAADELGFLFSRLLMLLLHILPFLLFNRLSPIISRLASLTRDPLPLAT